MALTDWRTRKQAAQSMVEFALILPLLLLVVLGILTFGHFMFVYSVTTSASREAARYGSAVGLSENNIERYRDCAAIRAAALRVGAFGGLQASDIQIYYYDNSSKTPVVTNPSGSASNTTPIGSCPPGANTSTYTPVIGQRIQVQVTTNYVPIVPFVSMPSFPVISASIRTILKDVTVGTAPPAGSLPGVTPSPSPGGGGGGGPTGVTLTITSYTPTTSIVGTPAHIVINYSLSGISAVPTGTVYVSIDGVNYPCTAGATLGTMQTGVCVIDVTFATSGSRQVNLVFQSSDTTRFDNANFLATHRALYNTITVLQPDADGESAPGETVNFVVTVDADPSANAQAQNVRPLGAVEIIDAANTVVGGPVTVGVSGAPYRSQATVPVTFAGAGTRTLSARFVPDGATGTDFNPSTSSPITHIVTASYDVPLIVTLSTNNAVFGSTITVSFRLDLTSVPDPKPVPTGMVSVVLDGTVFCSPASVVMPAAGGSCVLPANKVGTFNIVTTFENDPKYAAKTDTKPVTIVKDNVTFSALAASPATTSTALDTTYNWTIRPVTNPTGIQPTGTVEIRYNGIALCGGGVVTATCVNRFPDQVMGATTTYTLTAHYSGDANFNPKDEPLSIRVVACPAFSNFNPNSGVNGIYAYQANFQTSSSAITISRVDYSWPPQNGPAIWATSAHIMNTGTALNSLDCKNKSTTCIFNAPSGPHDPPVTPPLHVGCSGGGCQPFFSDAGPLLNLGANSVKTFVLMFHDPPAVPDQNIPYTISVYTSDAMCPRIDFRAP